MYSPPYYPPTHGQAATRESYAYSPEPVVHSPTSRPPVSGSRRGGQNATGGPQSPLSRRRRRPLTIGRVIRCLYRRAARRLGLPDPPLTSAEFRAAAEETLERAKAKGMRVLPYAPEAAFALWMLLSFTHIVVLVSPRYRFVRGPLAPRTALGRQWARVLEMFRIPHVAITVARRPFVLVGRPFDEETRLMIEDLTAFNMLDMSEPLMEKPPPPGTVELVIGA